MNVTHDLPTAPHLNHFAIAALMGIGFMAVACRGPSESKRDERSDSVTTGHARDAGAAPYWTNGTVTVPRPVALTTVDYDRHEINAYVLVLGADAGEHLRLLHRKTAAADSGAFIDVAGPSVASFTYLPLTLGDIRGYSPKFHLYGFGTDARLASDVERVATAVAGIIVAQADTNAIDNVMLAARAIASSGRRVPVAILGNDEVGRGWTAASGANPIFRGPPSEEGFSSALKAVSKEILTSLRDSSPPAAASPAPPSKPWWKVW